MVAALADAWIAERGHDINAVFERWLQHHYRHLESGGASRELSVRADWTDHILPFLLAHGASVGESGIFCVEELNLVLVGLFRQHLRSGEPAPERDFNADSGPTLLGAVTVREAVENYHIPKSTVENYRRANRFPGAAKEAGIWRIPLDDLRRSGLLSPDRPGRGRPTREEGLGVGTTGNIMWILEKVVGFARDMGVPVVGDPTKGMASTRSKKTGKPRATRKTVTLTETRELAGRLHIVHQLVLWILRTLGLRISEAFGLRVVIHDRRGTRYDLSDLVVSYLTDDESRALEAGDESILKMPGLWCRLLGFAPGESVEELSEAVGLFLPGAIIEPSADGEAVRRSACAAAYRRSSGSGEQCHAGPRSPATSAGRSRSNGR